MSIFLPAQDPAVAKRRRWKAVLFCAVTLAGICFLKPAWSALGKLRAGKRIAEGEAYLAQGRRLEALAAGRAALKSGANDARVCALLLNTLGSENFSEALYFWTKLSSRHNISLEQRRALVRWAVSWGQPDLAAPHWGVLHTDDPHSIETLRLGAALAEARGEAACTVGYAQAVLQQKQEDKETRLILGRVLVQNGAARDREIGKRLLLEQAQRADPSGLYALRFLSGSDVVSPFEAAECLRWLNANPAGEVRDILTAAAFQLKITGYKKDETIAEAVRHFIAKKGDLLQLAVWFSKGEHWNELLAHIPEEDALKGRELLLVYLDALGATQKWPEVERLLTNARLPLDSLSTALFLARAASQAGEEQIAELRWAQAYEIAGKESGRLLRVAEYARRCGQAQAAERACETLIAKGGEAAKRGYRELLKGQNRDLAKARATLRRFTAEFPDDAAAWNDLAYAELALGEATESVLAKMQATARTKPGSLGYQTTRALALLRSGKAEEAKAAFGIEPKRWPELLPCQQAIYAAASGAAGDWKFAHEICAGIDPAKLRREELELIKPWL
jgi:hypothetical protein